MKLHLEDVSFSYPSGVQALDQVNLVISPGEIVAIVGENGAGKTTLAKHFNGLLRPSQGRVWVGDWDAADKSTAQLAARVGFVFQNPDEQLFEASAEKEVAFGPRNLGLAPAEVQSRVRRALRQVGLGAKAGVNPYDMQPFERKLLALASTLAMQSPALVLDEPSMGQDAAGKQRIGGILQTLQAGGRTVIFISHDLDFCAAYAQRVIVMAAGRILADGAPGEVLSQTRLLQQAAVRPPQLLRLAQALKLPGAPLSAAEFVDLYAARRERKRR